MNRWEQIVVVPYGLLLIANFPLILACLVRGSRLKRLCRLALWVDGIFLVLTLAPLVLMVCRVQVSPEARLAFLATFLLLLAPLAAELLALAAIFRWWMREPPKPTA